MKDLRTITERIFLGRRSGNPVERFQDHLILEVPLLIAGAFGAGFVPLLTGIGAPDQLVQVCIAGTAAAVVSSVVVMAYVLLASALLAAISLSSKDAKSTTA